MSSKEQKTIEELAKKISEFNEEYKDKFGEEDKPEFFTKQEMEQYAQAKVLEALEIEVPEAFRQGRIEENNIYSIPNYNKIRSTKYYETEVKPKYKH